MRIRQLTRFTVIAAFVCSFLIPATLGQIFRDGYY